MWLLISRLLCFVLSVLLLELPCSSGHQPANVVDGFDDETCGRQPPSQLSLIKGGYSTEPGEWPWHVAIFYQEGTTQQEYRCGGTLIHKYLVLTAAHCVTRPKSRRLVDAKVIRLGFGRYDISLQEEEHMEERRVEQIIVHSEYTPATHNHDIALLKVDRPVIFSAFIRPACLWKRDDGYVLKEVRGELGTVIGWGLTDKDEVSDVLRVARMPVVDTCTCLQRDRLFFGNVLNQQSFCAGFRNGWPNYPTSPYIGFTDAALHIDWVYQFAPLQQVDDPILSHPNVRLINQGNCGRFSNESIRQFPWMVAVRYDGRSNQHIACNGVLLNRNHILSASCIETGADYVQVVLGDYNTETLRDCLYAYDYGCNPPVQINQIAELHSKDNLVLSRLAFPAMIGLRINIEAICLPIDPALRSGFASEYLRTGWTYDTDHYSVLQHSKVEFVDHLKFSVNDNTTAEPPCLEEDRVDIIEYYTPLGPLVPKDRIICVRNRGVNGSDPCPNFGSGTALLTFPKALNRFALFGLLEHDTKCHPYARFINIANYLEWILDNLRV